MVQGSLTISSCGPRKREQSKGQGRVLGFAFVWMREGAHVGRWFAGLVSTVCVCVRFCAFVCIVTILVSPWKTVLDMTAHLYHA